MSLECRSALNSLTRRQQFSALLLAIMAIIGIGTVTRRSRRDHDLQHLPRITLWAWERPEDLRALESNRFAVAYLAQTIVLRDRPVSVPRMQPLQVTRGAAVIAVVRIEGAPLRLSEEAAKQVANMILKSAKQPGISAVQIDFDARTSQRPFYRAVLGQVRDQLPTSMPLSITALASWCAGDDWIANLPVDEAVPMFFRMGGARPRNPGWTYPLLEPKCMSSAGVSMDEAWPHISVAARIYVFHPEPWNAAALHNLDQLLKVSGQP
jgi:Protein of unknown function (DUF3142)